MKSLIITLLIVPATLLAGCAGGRGTIRADGDLIGPVSLTRHVLDENGRKLTSGQDLKKVGSFTAKTKLWATGASLIPLNNGWDLTKRLNAEMRKHKGDAVVNLRIEEDAALPLYTYLAALTVVLPTWVDVTVRGDVVRRKSTRKPKPSNPVSPTTAMADGEASLAGKR